MLDFIFSSILESGITAGPFLICTAVSLLCGFLIAFCHNFFERSSKGFSVTVALLPAIVQVVIMLVNGNLGTGIAVAGAFSLIRFRSVAGSAREILCIFSAMAAGLAAGVGYVGIAVIFVLMICAANILYMASGFGEQLQNERELKITIPEDLNYTSVFDDLFKKYTCAYRLKGVKTSNMGSLYRLTYSVKLKKNENEKDLIDALRCRNGNLDITCNYCATASEEL